MEYPQYDPGIADAPLSDEELDALDQLLQASGDHSMNIEVMDGYLTALLTGPRLVDRRPTRSWLPVVWGGDGEGSAPFASNRQRKRATVLVLRHLHSIACKLKHAPDRWEPVFSVAQADGRLLVDAEDWCIGFFQGVALDPDAWAPFFDSAQLDLRPIILLGADESELSADDVERLSDPLVRDETSRAVTAAVVALAGHVGAPADAASTPR